jgi:hypothetical protein
MQNFIVDLDTMPLNKYDKFKTLKLLPEIVKQFHMKYQNETEYVTQYVGKIQ